MDSLLPGSRLGRYEVLERIGRGGMASVFRAHDPELDRDVAIKVLPSYRAETPALVERFTQEAQARAGLMWLAGLLVVMRLWWSGRAAAAGRR
jgi:serine/threonine protein kinase